MRRRVDLSWNEDYSKLAAYNSERARGVVHTAEWDQYMAQIQARFIAETLAVAAANGDTVHP